MLVSGEQGIQLNNNEIAVLLTLIVISGVFFGVASRSNKPKKTSETHDEEVMPWEPREFNSSSNLPIINQPSDSKRVIPGVNEYGIDPTVFDFSTLDVSLLDPIKDYHVIGYIAAVAEEEAIAEAEAQTQNRRTRAERRRFLWLVMGRWALKSMIEVMLKVPNNQKTKRPKDQSIHDT